MELQTAKQQIIIETGSENYNIERKLLRSTPYELLIINRSTDALLACSSLQTVTIINNFIPITAEVVSQMPPSIKVIAKLRTGYESIDVKACRQRNIEVCHVPDYATDTIADHTVALVFAVQRRLLTLHKSIIDKHIWNSKILGNLRSLDAMTFGIIGCRRIGTSFANKIRLFVKKILTHNSKDPTTSTLREIFEQCDIIPLHIPYSTANHHLISSDSIAQMKLRLVLINVSRGGLVDTNALVQALKSGQISYAALDVLEGEPNIDEELIQLENVLLTPHAAWNSVDAERLAKEKAIKDAL